MGLRLLTRSLLRSVKSAPLCTPSRFLSSRRTRARSAAPAGDVANGDDSEESPIPGLFVLSRGDLSLPPPRLLLVQPRLRPEPALQHKLSEAVSLADSLEEPRGDCLDGVKGKKRSPTPHIVVQNPAARVRSAVRADKYFGPGTVDNVKYYMRDLETKDNIDAIFVNAILSGIQQRNLEVAWGKPVLDRVGLIIEIFNAHAETKEAKLQSELAALMYKKTRLVRVRGPGGQLAFGPSGEAEVVSARGRGGSGGRGFMSGAGETELQLQRRRIEERRNKLVVQIEEVRRTRSVQRSSRKKHGLNGGLSTVAIVGYTNAGKSTLVGALSEADLYSDDRLFATVDPRLRGVILPKTRRKALLSDTVGFISDLPVQLVEAFHATLEEVVEADLLVHVLDASVPNFEEHRSTVLQVLHQIGVSEDKIRNMVEVWNKIDLVERSNGVDDRSEFVHDALDETSQRKQDEDQNNEVAHKTQFVKDGDVVLEIATGLPEFSSDVAVSDTFHENRHGKMVSEEEVEEAFEFSSLETLDGDGDGDECESDGSGDCDDDHDAMAPELSLGKHVTEISNYRLPVIPSSCHVRISATKRIGLQELLHLIDDKLSEQRAQEERTFGPFDRKWRSFNFQLDDAVQRS